MNAQKIAQYTRTQYNSSTPVSPDMWGDVSLDWERIQAEAPAELRQPAIDVVRYNAQRDVLVFPADLEINFPAEIENRAAQYRQWVREFFS